MAIAALREQPVTNCNQLNGIESDTVKVVESDQFNATQRVANTENVLTNADHIRSMSDEELAEFLVYFSTNRCDQCVYEGHCTSKCIGGVKGWLRKPAEVPT